jgi:hypothetical protein
VRIDLHADQFPDTAFSEERAGLSRTTTYLQYGFDARGNHRDDVIANAGIVVERSGITRFGPLIRRATLVVALRSLG